jgi:hypothetical protein
LLAEPGSVFATRPESVEQKNLTNSTVYHFISTLLFWFYWAIAAVTLVLLAREIWSEKNWKLQATAALAILPFILRVLLLK